MLEETNQIYVEYGEQTCEELKQFISIAMKAKIGVFEEKDKKKKMSPKRCRYWNRGYCREGTSIVCDCFEGGGQLSISLLKHGITNMLVGKH